MELRLKVAGPGTISLASLGDVAGVDSGDFSGDGTFSFARGGLNLVESGTNGVTAALAAANPARIDVSGGTLKLTGETTLPVDKMLLAGNLTLAGPRLAGKDVDIAASSSLQPPVTVEVGTTNAVGVLRLESGSVTGRVSVATYGSASVRGAVYQTGGELVNVTKYGETDVIGAHGYAYYELAGGRYVAAGDWYLGHNGEGILNIVGGTLWHTPSTLRKSRCRIGDSMANVQLLVGTNGVFDANNVSEAVIFPGYNRSDASGQITVENGGELRITTKGFSIGMGYGSSAVGAIVNLNSGGVIVTPSICRHSGYVYPSAEWPEGTAKEQKFTNTYAAVNCNGGIIRSRSWSYNFGSRAISYAYPPSRVTLYEGGLTVDTTGYAGGTGPGSPLRAPSGKGVVAVAWTAEDAAWFAGEEMIGPPIVRIVGDGKGATAVADFDSKTGLVTGIRVTGFGNDYTSATAQLIWNKTVRRTLACTLAACPSGGFTKIGSGTFTFNETNTYTGATVVRGGTLKLGAPDVVSPASKLVLAGGTLDLGGFHQSFADISCDGGSVANGTAEVTGLAIDFADVRKGTARQLDANLFSFAAGATLQVLNMTDADFADENRRYKLAQFTNGKPANFPSVEGVQSQLPEGWVISVTSSGLRISKRKGSVLLVR